MIAYLTQVDGVLWHESSGGREYGPDIELGDFAGDSGTDGEHVALEGDEFVDEGHKQLPSQYSICELRAPSLQNDTGSRSNRPESNSLKIKEQEVKNDLYSLRSTVQSGLAHRSSSIEAVDTSWLQIQLKARSEW